MVRRHTACAADSKFSSPLNRIRIGTSDSNSNRISKLCRSLLKLQFPGNKYRGAGSGLVYNIYVLIAKLLDLIRSQIDNTLHYHWPVILG